MHSWFFINQISSFIVLLHELHGFTLITLRLLFLNVGLKSMIVLNFYTEKAPINEKSRLAA